MNRKESYRSRKTEESGIYLLVDPQAEEHLIQDLIFPVMSKIFPEVLFAVFVIEDGDELKDLTREIPPRAFIFDAQRKFQWKKHSYSARDLILRLISRFSRVKGILMTDEEVYGEGDKYCLEGCPDQQSQDVLWFKKLKGKKHSGLVSVETLMKSVFSHSKHS